VDVIPSTFGMSGNRQKLSFLAVLNGTESACLPEFI